jgi:serine/threonine protein kinase
VISDSEPSGDYAMDRGLLANLVGGKQSSRPLSAGMSGGRISPVGPPKAPAFKGNFTPGTLLDGRFDVLRAIKSGGMGSVYEVADRKLGNKTFALKEMINTAKDVEEMQTARLRFISEIQVMMSLRHPNIPRVTASFMHENSFCFVMEMIPGMDLSQRLKENGAPGLPATEVVGWTVQILDALRYIHRLTPPIVHRDIKPSNILLCPDGRVVLVDFGIARITNPGEGLWIGTPGYAPPEQQFGRPEPRSDLYALGATVHELLTGEKPEGFDFAGFEELGIKIDPKLEQVLSLALATFPEDRISSATEMAKKLKGLSSFSLSMPEPSLGYDFESAVCEYKLQALDPLLRKLMSTYANECHTSFLPQNLDFIQLILACPTQFELQIVKDEQAQRIRFFEKQGILDAKLLGEINPLEASEFVRTVDIIDVFVKDYENFKGSSWGLMS